MVLKVGWVNRKRCASSVYLVVPSIIVAIVGMLHSAKRSFISGSILLGGRSYGLAHGGSARVRITSNGDVGVADLGHTRPVISHGVKSILVLDIND